MRALISATVFTATVNFKIVWNSGNEGMGEAGWNSTIVEKDVVIVLRN